ncbi:MAG TPA: hypothetical protein VGX25_13430 [Actinophytocola sp.]|uniref:hypothetical protein n=1 Tax=Actinophytocola sp. TaxID=1872138 RepID=UPI002DDCC1BC|nr:hypothetical protein [Actinophytocola sp.]HEV2780385.1 hypothetical protein [Actinophytocola sp.]
MSIPAEMAEFDQQVAAYRDGVARMVLQARHLLGVCGPERATGLIAATLQVAPEEKVRAVAATAVVELARRGPG